MDAVRVKEVSRWTSETVVGLNKKSKFTQLKHKWTNYSDDLNDNKNVGILSHIT